FLKLRFASVTVALLSVSACADFVSIDPPRTDLVRETVFTTDDNANAAALDLYYKMSYVTGFGSGGVNSIAFLCALSADEVTNRLTASGYQEINDNELQPTNARILQLWSELYNCIYKANALLEGLALSAK